MPDDLELKQILTNLKGWACWDFKSYQLRENEAQIVIAALEACLKNRETKKRR